MKKNNYNLLKNICEKIDKLSKEKHIAILKIFKKDKINITENNNGCFINMNEVSDSILNEIIKYLEFNINNENELKKQETIKQSIIENILNNNNNNN
tara:strand:- start:125 stop:415 length:291 start_codon:yes stop_codon:yes gene_type:complete